MDHDERSDARPNPPGPGSSFGDLDLLRDGYDAFYESAPGSELLQQLWATHAMGTEFPQAFSHISFLTMEEAESLSSASGLGAGDHLVDLACGTGGPGLLLAALTGARLTGVDLSPVGVAKATARSERVGMTGISRFMLGTFEHSGLPARCADAVLSVDAIQYCLDKRSAVEEMARLLRPGGRLLLTGFEVDPDRVAGFPVLGLDPVADYTRLLEGAGFDIESYEESQDWRGRLLSAYDAVLQEAESLVAEMGERSYAPLALEASSTLGFEPYRRRVLVVATRR
jgi:ubiquinone/menaquinone biosynthesis C-methylase UbiE